MNMHEALVAARGYLLMADMFQRQAETILDKRMASAAMRNAFLTPEDKREVEMLLRSAYEHRQSAIDQLAGELPATP